MSDYSNSIAGGYKMPSWIAKTLFKKQSITGKMPTGSCSFIIYSTKPSPEALSMSLMVMVMMVVVTSMVMVVTPMVMVVTSIVLG